MTSGGGIFVVGEPVDKVWLHMEFDFEDTLLYLGEKIIETEEEARRLYEKYAKPDKAYKAVPVPRA